MKLKNIVLYRVEPVWTVLFFLLREFKQQQNHYAWIRTQNESIKIWVRHDGPTLPTAASRPFLQSGTRLLCLPFIETYWVVWPLSDMGLPPYGLHGYNECRLCWWRMRRDTTGWQRAGRYLMLTCCLWFFRIAAYFVKVLDRCCQGLICRRSLLFSVIPGSISTFRTVARGSSTSGRSSMFTRLVCYSGYEQMWRDI